MKDFRSIFFLIILMTQQGCGSHGQKLVSSGRLYNVPSIAPDTYFAVSLDYMGFKKWNYNVLVKVRLPDNPTYYTIPGRLPTGHVFHFRVKPGSRTHSDTLYLIHRGGERPVRLEEVLVLAIDLRKKFRPLHADQTFIRRVLNTYHNDSTRRGSKLRGVQDRNVSIPIFRPEWFPISTIGNL